MANYKKIPNLFVKFFRKHDSTAANIVISINFLLGFLHLFGFAEYKSIEPTTLTRWSENGLWTFIFLFTAIWLLLFRFPPKVIWGLWVSVATFGIWGSLIMYVGLTASHPVSLLGPSLLLFIITPIAWISAEKMANSKEIIEKVVNK